MSDILTMNKNLVDASGRPINIPTVDEVNAEDIPIEERGLQLPDPKGYRILCAIPEASDTYESGLAKAGQTKHIEEHSTVVLFVVRMVICATRIKKDFQQDHGVKRAILF